MVRVKPSPEVTVEPDPDEIDVLKEIVREEEKILSVARARLKMFEERKYLLEHFLPREYFFYTVIPSKEEKKK